MSKRNLLYVDDEPINLQLFELNFRRDFNLFLASSAKEGLEILKENDISLIVSDLKMPEMNGLEFLTEVKKLNPNDICIILSAFIESEIKNIGESKGVVDCFISKPWRKAEVLLIIDDLIEKYNK